MMDTSYRQFFALTKEPFGADIPRKDIMVTKALGAMEERIHYPQHLQLKLLHQSYNGIRSPV